MYDSEFPGFRALPLCAESRAQLGGIYETAKTAVNKRKLLDLLTSHAYDQTRGLYMPLSSSVKVLRKLPEPNAESISSSVPSAYCYFSNALVIPPSHGIPAFESQMARPPVERLTNAGHLTITLEVDNTTIDDLEENLSWTRVKSGQQSLVERVHEVLSSYSEYRECCVVYSGNRSLHFHFVFSTIHLRNAPCNALAEARRASSHDPMAVLMGAAHEEYWDRTSVIFTEVVGHPVAFDRRLRGATQWRRAPWGMRLIVPEDEKKAILGFKPGMRIPQIVLREDIRSRAARGHDGYLVSAEFVPSAARRPSVRRQGFHKPGETVHDEVMDVIRDLCFEDWGDYPRAASVETAAEGWLIRFHNGPDDRTPSTIVKGDFRRLLLGGSHHFERDLYLPDGFTANEIVDHANWICRQGAEADDITNHTAAGNAQKALRGTHPIIQVIEKDFERPIVPGATSTEVRSILRERLARLSGLIRSIAARPILVDTGKPECHPAAILIKSAEGIGKTHALFGAFPGEALDDAIERYGRPRERDEGGTVVGERFCAFAFRSLKQARAKAAEFEHRGRGRAVVMSSFRRQYEEACSAVGLAPIPHSELSTFDHGPVLAIKARQPDVHERMERARRELWTSEHRFNSGTTILFMTHGMVKTWQYGRTTRVWSHPDFNPEVSIENQQHLRNDFHLGKIAFDEPEIDDVLCRCSKADYQALIEAQNTHKAWRLMSRFDREAVFDMYEDRCSFAAHNFETFDEWMRCDISEMECITVDYDRIPFGVSSGDNDMYRRQNGVQIYIGPREWLFSSGFQMTYLTTENLISDVISVAYRKRGLEAVLSRFDLDLPSTLPPVEITLYQDRRASKTRLIELIDEIVCHQPDAKIIADTLTHPSVINFVSMKGANAFQNDDTYIIPTFLGAEHYGEMNALGIYLGRNDIIETYYGDNLNQGCGRNRGFRESSVRTTTTTVVVSQRLYKAVISKLVNGDRYAFKLVRRPPWETAAQ